MDGGKRTVPCQECVRNPNTLLTLCMPWWDGSVIQPGCAIRRNILEFDNKQVLGVYDSSSCFALPYFT